MFNLPYEKADALLQTMTPEKKIGQMVMASVEITEMDDKTRAFLRANQIGNVILFGKNCVDRAQLAELNAALQKEISANTGVQALLSIDQEGGPVIRIRNGATVFPCAMAVGAAKDEETAYLVGRIMGAELKALGIYWNFAPVLDINGNDQNPLIGRRSYGACAADVALYAGAAARGMRDAGIIDCGKHFPGHGYSKVDTHFAFSLETTPRAEIEEKFLPAFSSLMEQGLRSIMTTHICYADLEPERLPATMSKRIVQGLAREKLGFKGLVISDGMQMHAVSKTYGAPRGCVMAIKAGCDMVITGNGGDNAAPDEPDVQTPCVRALLDALKSGELTMERVNDSVRRILAFKLALGDMSPAADVKERDWRPHDAFAHALAYSAVKIVRDDENLLPLPKKTLFIGPKAKSMLGVAEGDHRLSGFAETAARLLDGTMLAYEGQPDQAAALSAAADAPAVVVAFSSPQESAALKPFLERLLTVNPRLGLVCMNAPYLLNQFPLVPCAVACYDQTDHALKAVCEVMSGVIY